MALPHYEGEALRDSDDDDEVNHHLARRTSQDREDPEDRYSEAGYEANVTDEDSAEETEEELVDHVQVLNHLLLLLFSYHYTKMVVEGIHQATSITGVCANGKRGCSRGI